MGAEPDEIMDVFGFCHAMGAEPDEIMDVFAIRHGLKMLCIRKG
jgi:hypothetical protein